MELKERKGRKHPEDRTIWIKSAGWELLHYTELAELCRRVYRNEDLIYPPAQGYRGGQMFVDFLEECMVSQEPIPEIAKRYKL